MGSILQSLGVVSNVVWAQIVAFIILFVFVAVYLVKPIQDILRQRQEQIANSLASAEAQKSEAESLRQQYEAHLTNIADEARTRLDQAMKDAEAARQRVLESAQSEIHEMQQRNQAQLALERDQLRHELRAEMANVAIMASTKALRGQLPPDLGAAINDQVIRELEQSTARQA